MNSIHYSQAGLAKEPALQAWWPSTSFGAMLQALTAQQGRMAIASWRKNQNCLRNQEENDRLMAQTKVHECHAWSSSSPSLTQNSLFFSAMEKRPCRMPYWFHAWLHCKASVQVIKSPRKNERHVVRSAKACPQTARHHKGKTWERRNEVLSYQQLVFEKTCSKDWNHCVTKMDHGRNALN